MNEQMRTIFEKENYLDEVNGYPERPVEWFNKHIKPDALKYFEGKKNLLDVGCAFGYYTKEFVGNFNEIFGIDFARNRIDWAKNNWKGINFVCTAIEDFKHDKKFDAIFTSMVIQHIPKDLKIKALKNLHSLASDDCIFLMYDFNWNNEEVDNKFVSPISPKWIKKYLNNYWYVESCDEFIRESPGAKGMIFRYVLKRR